MASLPKSSPLRKYLESDEFQKKLIESDVEDGGLTCDIIHPLVRQALKDLEVHFDKETDLHGDMGELVRQIMARTYTELFQALQTEMDRALPYIMRGQVPPNFQTLALDNVLMQSAITMAFVIDHVQTAWKRMQEG